MSSTNPDDPNATILDEPTVRVPRLGSETIELGEPIAEGGMGEVLVARQPRMSRTVAVKRPRPDKKGATEALIAEALVTGALEHPNVVPVYDLHTDGRGPLMVMKRVEGTEWTAIIEDPDLAGPHLDGRSELELHIDVLLAVCNAVQFAHDRGIVHRDLKPDNVMLGSYGEIYVMDWGLAVSTRPSEAGFPLASEARRVAGTPAFMAPEMVRADGSVDERTDVYLLGATLYFVLTGRTRHGGSDLKAVIEAARRSEPPFWPDGVLPELARIATRATAADPGERYPTVEAFRRALLGYRKNIASVKLTGVARRCTAVLAAMVQQELDGEEQDPSAVSAMAIEGRFGFRQALDEWPDNPDAARGLQKLIRLQARYELHKGNEASASALLDELDDADPELVAALDELRAAIASRRAAQGELDRLSFEQDLSVNALRRGGLGCGLGLVVTALCAAVGFLNRSGIWPIGYGEMLAAVTLFGAAVAVGSLIAGRLAVNAAVRREQQVLRLVTIGVVVHWLASAWTGLPIADAFAWNALIAGGMLIASGLVADAAAAAAGLVQVGTGLAVLLVPWAAFEVYGLGQALSYGVFAAFTAGRAVR